MSRCPDKPMPTPSARSPAGQDPSLFPASRGSSLRGEGQP